MFDKDDFKDSDFNEAIRLADSYGFHAAYSNQAFEYWLILHLNDHQGGSIHRDLYSKMINDCIGKSGIEYKGTSDKIVSEGFFNFMLVKDTVYNKRRIDLAIDRAIRNNKIQPEKSPAKKESSTTVYKLVEEILKYM